MGRLFWKFFLIVWLTQLAVIAATGALFWIERQQSHSQFATPHGGPPGLPRPERGPPPAGAAPFAQPAFAGPPPADGPAYRPPPHRRPPPPAIPVLHIATGLLASLLSAAGIAWLVVQPVRRLRQGLAAAAGGDLSARIGPAMGPRRDELAELGTAFDHMSERLQTLIQTQRRLLHDVSHELRSPLARLQAAVGLARQQPARFAESLDRIQREGEKMDCLVGELLTLARLEAGETAARERVDLGELIADLVEDARFESAARPLTITLEHSPQLLIEADPAQIQRALDNVLRNALRYAPANSTLTVRCRQVSPVSVRVVIEDEGPGAPPELLGQLFEPFVRADDNGGFGLGLAIARRAIAAAGGEISAENRAEGGFRVRITLPLIAAEQRSRPGFKHP
jgi:signal transduction histidine kinase